MIIIPTDLSTRSINEIIHLLNSHPLKQNEVCLLHLLLPLNSYSSPIINVEDIVYREKVTMLNTHLKKIQLESKREGSIKVSGKVRYGQYPSFLEEFAKMDDFIYVFKDIMSLEDASAICKLKRKNIVTMGITNFSEGFQKNVSINSTLK